MISADGVEFVVPVKILKHSPTFANMIEGDFKEKGLIFVQ